MVMKTPAQEFAFHKAGYQKRIVTNKFGDLLIDNIPYRVNLPFALLQSERQKLRRNGIISKRIKITYHV